MLGHRRRSKAGGIQATIEAQTIAGPTAIGDHIVQYVAGGDLSITQAPQRAVPRPRPLPVALLPRDFAGLEGRAGQLDRAFAALARGEPVEVVGGDGAGKTVLLRHLVHHAQGVEAPDGTVYAGVAGQPLDDVLAQVFEAFFTWDEAALPTRAQITTELTGVRALVVLDDLELDRDDVGRLLDVIPRSPVAFSGATRRRAGEAESVELSGVDAAVAAALFERALGDEHEAPPRDELQALCRALGGRPLLVVQAADLMRSGRVTWAQLRDAASAQAVAELRDREYSDGELRALAPLLALPGVALAPETVAAITGHPEDAATLERLCDAGIVRRNSPRYRFAGEPSAELAQRVDAEAWRTRSLETAAAGGCAPDDGPLVTALLEHGIAVRRFDLVLALARRADPALALAGRWGAWSIALGAALAAGEASGDGAAVAWAHHQLGTAAVVRGDPAAGIAHLTAALRERERLGDSDGARRTAEHLRQAGGGGAAPVVRTPVPPRTPSWLRWTALVAVAAAGVAGGVLIGRGTAPASTTQTGGVVTKTKTTTQAAKTVIRPTTVTVQSPPSTVSVPPSTVTLPPVTVTVQVPSGGSSNTGPG